MTRMPPVLRSAHVLRSPEETFAAFTDEIGAWWPLPTHGLFGDRAGGLAFEGGRLVERAVDGEECLWGEVLVWEPPHRLVVTWHPGRPTPSADEPGSQVEVRFVGDEDGTRVEVEHRGWESFGVDAAIRRHGYVGPSAWGHVLDHFAGLAEACAPDPSGPGADLDGLRAAYETFFAAAELGGFEAPPDGEWDAVQVLAHVALNDLMMVAVSQAIVHGREVTFTNTVCQDRDVMSRYVARVGDLPALIAQGRRLARVAIAAVGRLSAEERAAAVPCVLHHDGVVVLDAAMPWGAVAVDVQAARHLPAHTGQLAALRP